MVRGYDGDYMDEREYVEQEWIYEDPLESLLDYYKLCDRCALHQTFTDQPLCKDCEKEMRDEVLNDEYEHYETKAERRERKNHRAQYGMVRNMPGDFRPPKLKVNIRVTVRGEN